MAQVVTGIDEVVKVIYHRKDLFHMDSKEDSSLHDLKTKSLNRMCSCITHSISEISSYFVKSFVVKKLMESLET